MQRIHVIGYNESIILFSLLGIEGTVVSHHHKFMDIFNNLIENSLINMIIISMDLPENIINYLSDFKLNHIRPFIYLMPKIFQKELDDESLLLKKIYRSVGRILV
ncbi:MAG: hypothetical protein KGD57_01925 [Candidatus Lokiarchaeota archaeon]|nr:hypothetical protein [Candidatus Lokiarchaeota archaeon]